MLKIIKNMTTFQFAYFWRKATGSRYTSERNQSMQEYADIHRKFIKFLTYLERING